MVKLIQVTEKEKATLYNLLEKYLYEFSQWEKTDVDENGLYNKVVFEVLDKHHGKWQLKRHPHNVASVHFWNSVIDEYTKGQYRLVEAYPDSEVDYEDGTPADVFFFEN